MAENPKSLKTSNAEHASHRDGRAPRKFDLIMAHPCARGLFSKAALFALSICSVRTEPKALFVEVRTLPRDIP
jgi:hypothetical protein